MNQGMLSITDAAERLSVTERTVYNLIGAGRLATHGKPVRLDAQDVARLMAERQGEAARARPDRAAFARQIRERLFPEAPDQLYAHAFEQAAFMSMERGAKVVPKLHPDAHALWGKHALTVATWSAEIWPVDACKTCYVHNGARHSGTPDPQNTEDWRILLGPPCAKDMDRWRGEQTALVASAVAGTRQRADAYLARLKEEEKAAAQDVRRATNVYREKRDAVLAAGGVDAFTEAKRRRGQR